jgi:hypothetical protein
MYTGWDSPRLRGARSRAARQLCTNLDALAPGQDWKDVVLPIDPQSSIEVRLR